MRENIPTPRTDAVEIIDPRDYPKVRSDFARQLERQLDEARQEAKDFEDLCRKLTQERDEAREALAGVRELLANEMRERDRVSNALVHCGRVAAPEIKECWDTLDLMRDEFQRILILTENEEIKGLCERARTGIKQRVPVIEQRDKAERERDQLRAQLAEAREAQESWQKKKPSSCRNSETESVKICMKNESSLMLQWRPSTSSARRSRRCARVLAPTLKFPTRGTCLSSAPPSTRQKPRSPRNLMPTDTPTGQMIRLTLPTSSTKPATLMSKKDPPSAHLGENIRAARVAANLTQLALAHKLGYSGPDAGAYISRLESGQEPRIDTLGKLAKALDTTIEALLAAPGRKKK